MPDPIVIIGYALPVLLMVVTLVLLTCCTFGNQDHQSDADERPETDARPPPDEAAAQMAYMAIALLDHVTYPRQTSVACASSDGASAGTGGGGDPSAGTPLESEDCAICLCAFEDGDWCSIMPVCRHEFHRACIEDWLRTYNNSCPLCRAQLQWSAVVEDMV